MPGRMERLARDVLTSPLRITVGEVGAANEDINQVMRWICCRGPLLQGLRPAEFDVRLFCQPGSDRAIAFHEPWRGYRLTLVRYRA